MDIFGEPFFCLQTTGPNQHIKVKEIDVSAMGRLKLETVFTHFTTDNELLL